MSRITKIHNHPLSITTFNMLADSLANSFPNTDSKFLKWDHRKPRILEILKGK
jgi:mRNA deadenylase 3'-5' endonuclease subunit Ccr4